MTMFDVINSNVHPHPHPDPHVEPVHPHPHPHVEPVVFHCIEECSVCDELHCTVDPEKCGPCDNRRCEDCH